MFMLIYSQNKSLGHIVVIKKVVHAGEGPLQTGTPRSETPYERHLGLDQKPRNQYGPWNHLTEWETRNQSDQCSIDMDYSLIMLQQQSSWTKREQNKVLLLD